MSRKGFSRIFLFLPVEKESERDDKGKEMAVCGLLQLLSTNHRRVHPEEAEEYQKHAEQF